MGTAIASLRDSERRAALKADLKQSWATGSTQAKALARWLWVFFNAPGPHETPREPASDVAIASPGATAHPDWLREILLTLRPAYKQAIMQAFLINLIGLAAAIFTLQVYDRVVTHGGMSSLLALVIGMVIAIFIDYLLRVGRALLLQRVGLQIETEIARRAFARMLELPTLVLESRPQAYWQTVFRDVELIRSVCSGPTALLLVDLPFLSLSLIFIGLIAFPLLPVALVTIIAFVVLAWRAGQATRGGAEAEREKLVGRDVMIAELATARVGLKALGAEAAARARWETNYAGWMAEALARSRDADRYRDLAHAMMLGNTVVTTGYGALVILSSSLTMGGLIAANILSGRMVSPLVQLVGQWRLFGQFDAAKKRLDALFAAQVDRAESGIALPRPKGMLLLDGASFRYPRTERDQLLPINGQIGPHGLHAIVGANGSAKTTLLKVMRGLYPATAGRVLLDGADIVQFSQADLARWIGWLPQQVQLISGTIRENITLGDPEASDEAIVLASRRAQAFEMIMSLPDGYATQVGDAGGRFSGGERKRIAIAQALLRDPPILLLDEPTADLDRDTEIAFCATLKEMARDHTVLCVTHSPAVLAQCNGILVMDRGRLVMSGPAAKILPQLGFAQHPPARIVHDAAA